MISHIGAKIHLQPRVLLGDKELTPECVDSNMYAQSILWKATYTQVVTSPSILGNRVSVYTSLASSCVSLVSPEVFPWLLSHCKARSQAAVLSSNSLSGCSPFDEFAEWLKLDLEWGSLRAKHIKPKGQSCSSGGLFGHGSTRQCTTCSVSKGYQTVIWNLPTSGTG
jgi:hypothetical protein